MVYKFVEETRRQSKSQMGKLRNEKDKLENLNIEMVIDLSSHQVDFPDPNASRNYFMMAFENMPFSERFFVDEGWINFSQYLGQMTTHRASGADATKFPASTSRVH